VAWIADRAPLAVWVRCRMKAASQDIRGMVSAVVGIATVERGWAPTGLAAELEPLPVTGWLTLQRK